MKRLFCVLAVLMMPALAMPPLVMAQDARRTVPDSQEQIRLSYAPVVKEVTPAVVNVYAKRVVRERGMNSMFRNDPFFRRFFGDGFGMPRERVQSSLGSGVIVSADGIVVTNNHVIEGAEEVRIALADRREFEAEIILKDERTDLAVLRAKDTDIEFPHLEFGNSDELEVGDLVLAIGNPFGVGQTVTSGIVSAVARTRVGITDYQFFIQTDAAINPGNSGGALVTMDGRLAGINTAIYSRSGGSMGIGFAIPANMVEIVVEAAESGGTVRRPWFGASMEAVTSEIAEALGLARPAGVLLNEIFDGSPAEEAGLEPGDIVLAIEDFEITDPGSFGFRLATRPIGTTATLSVMREGETFETDVEMVAPPEDPPRNETLLSGRHPLQGATVMNLSPAVADEMRLDFGLTGVVVAQVERGSIAQRYNLQPGDVVRQVNGADIETVDELQAAMNAADGRWRMSILREGRVLNVVLGG